MSQFGELLARLARAEVNYVLVGDGAVLLHGHSRTTADLDILVEANPENACRLLGALAQWGEGAGAQLTMDELAVPQLGALRVVEAFSLDIFTLMRVRGRDANLAFSDLIGDARTRTLSNGIEVRYASIARLLDLKANTGCPKDATDIAVLTEIAYGSPRAASGGFGGHGGGPGDGPNGPRRVSWMNEADCAMSAGRPC